MDIIDPSHTIQAYESYSHFIPESICEGSIIWINGEPLSEAGFYDYDWKLKDSELVQAN